MNAALAAGIAAVATVWLIWTVPTNAEAALRLFNIFVPLHGGVGFLLLGSSSVQCWREGWSRRVEEKVVFGLCMVAWWHDASRAAVRRAAQLAGYEDAVRLETNDYRIFSAVLLVVAGLMALRWLTKARFGEWLWLGLFVAWAAAVVLAGPWIQAAFVLAYRLTLG